MNYKRILSTALCAIMIFTMVVAFVPVRADAAHSPSAVVGDSVLTQEQIGEIVKATYEYNFTDPAEMLEYELGLGYLDYVNSPGNKYTLYINRYTGTVYYVNNATGEILTSNPYNPSYTTLSSDVKRDLMSQIVIEFALPSNSASIISYKSSEWAAEKGQISVSAISSGLRVNYTLGDTATRFLIPGQIANDDFVEHIVKPMLERYVETLELYCREELPEENFEFFDNDKYVAEVNGVFNFKEVSATSLRTYLTDTQTLYRSIYRNENAPERKVLDTLRNNIMRFMQKFVCYNPAGRVSQDTLNKYYEEAPATKEGTVVWVFNKGTANDEKTYATYIANYCPEYTFQQMYEDEAKVYYTYVIEQKPVFRCCLEYTFNADGSLSVRLPANSINFDETAYILKKVSPLVYFGAGDLNTDGYVFIPDGSGSVIEFEDFYNSNLKENVRLSLEMYGKDYCYSALREGSAYVEQVTMPVYGMISGYAATPYTQEITGKDAVRSGYFAILEEGSSLASLAVSFGGSSNKFATVYSSFSPYPSDTFFIQDTISVGASGQYTKVSESRYSGSYVTRYVMLSDADAQTATGEFGYEASYTGMATYYREYLKGIGELSALEDVNEKLPLYIEALGSMSIVKKVLSFPVTAAIPLTTFGDVITMYDELADAKQKLLDKAEEYKALAEAENKDYLLKESYEAKEAQYRELAEQAFDMTNINFRLTGFANGGMYFTYPTRVKWDSVTGGEDGFMSLLTESGNRTKDGRVFGVYPEFDFSYINNTSTFDGISVKNTVSKMVDNRYASKQVYNSIYNEWESFFNLVISPDALDGLYDKFYDKYSKYPVKGLSVSTLGESLNSNFDEDNPINREESAEYVTALLDRMANDNGYSLMLSKGNIYAIKYADHIVEVPTDSSHYRYSSYNVPFLGMVLHGYVNYAGAPLNYSGSPSYDMLHAIENGASLYYILCYQNTGFMKDDFILSEYYGVDYANWFDKIAEQYAVINKALGGLQTYEIVSHRTLIAERVIDEGEVLVNNKLLVDEFFGYVEAQLRKAIADAYDEMFEDEANEGRGLKVDVDVDALTAIAVSMLNMDSDDLAATEFIERLNAIATEFETEYAGKDENSYLLNFNSVTYTSKYNYVTDSFATDEDYVQTDYTVDNDLVTIVTYRDAKTGDEVRFLINYNLYDVTVSFDADTVYTVEGTWFLPIYD